MHSIARFQRPQYLSVDHLIPYITLYCCMKIYMYIGIYSDTCIN